MLPKKKVDDTYFRPWTIDDVQRFVDQRRDIGIPHLFSSKLIIISDEELKRAKKTGGRVKA